MVMKNLKDVLEKLRVDDIVIPDIELPKDLNREKMLNILHQCGFREIPTIEDGSFSDLKKAFNDAHSKAYMLTGIQNREKIRFADTTENEIGGRNVIFVYCPSSSIRYYYEEDIFFQFDIRKSRWYEKVNQLINR